MSEHSDEFEREVLDAVRELRGTVRAVKIVIGVVVALALLVAVAGLVNIFVIGGDSGTSSNPGNDVHAALEKGSSASVTTQAGLTATANITDVTISGQHVQVGTKVRGADGGTWYLYLATNQRIVMQGSDNIGSTGGWTVHAFDGEIPEGDRLQFVQFSPDDSHGDLYFDVR